MIKFQKKLIVSGKHAELYQYEKPIFKGLFSSTKKSIFKSENKDENRPDNLRRTRMMIRRIVNSNPYLSKFVTLTFAWNEKNVERANYEFKKFRQRIEYGEKFKMTYINVIEFQKRGAVHYHMLSNIDFIEKKKLQYYWAQGFVQINRISTVDNIGAYVSKYLTKETSRLNGHKKYFTSYDVQRPQQFIQEKDIDNLFKFYSVDPEKPIYENTYQSESFGDVVYRRFIFDSSNKNFIH